MSRLNFKSALGKENEYVPEQNDIAKQAQHQLRTNQSYFSVITSLYLNNHDFSQSKKILSVSSYRLGIQNYCSLRRFMRFWAHFKSKL